MSLRSLDVPTVEYIESFFSHSLPRGRSVAADLQTSSIVCLRVSMSSVRSVVAGVGAARGKTYSTMIVTPGERGTTPASHSVFSSRVFTLTVLLLSHRV